MAGFVWGEELELTGGSEVVRVDSGVEATLDGDGVGGVASWAKAPAVNSSDSTDIASSGAFTAYPPSSMVLKD